MNKVQRITVPEVRQKVKEGDALLVCTYESDDQFKIYQLENALSFHQFEKLLPGLSWDREIIFYCN